MGVTLAAVAGSVMVLAVVVLFAPLPGSLSEARDFRAARPCSEASAPESGDCLSEWPATVVSTETGRRHRAVIHWATADTGGEMPPFRVRMRGDGPVWKELAPGDRVAVFARRDLVWRLGSGELRQDATEKPGRASTAVLATGLVLLIVGSVFLRGAGWLHRRRATRAPAARASQVVVVTAATLLASGIAVTAAVATDSLLLALSVAAAGCAAAWTASALLLRRSVRRRAA